MNKQPKTVKNSIRADHISKKKKNTYCIELSPFANYELFALCKTTPLAISKTNGKSNETNGWIKSIHFPTECAQEIAHMSIPLRAKMGQKLSSTIIEYLDKETGEPVAQLYPTTLYVFDKYEETYLSRLNHATRRDLQRQMDLRAKILREYYVHQK